MTPFQHRVVLPPALLAIHCILLLPLFLPISSPSPGLLGLPLHLRYSIPLGIVGFVVVMITKQLAEKIPLPKDPRRKRFAEGLEWAVLFLVGFLEEIWRWGVVRILVNLEGGEGGYGNLSWLHMIKVANEDVSGSNIWKGVYFMGWVWCCIESGFAWRCFAPHGVEKRQSSHPHHHRHDRSNRPRLEYSPQASPRTSYFPHFRDNQGISPSANVNENANPFFNPFGMPVWDGTARQNLSKTSLTFREPPRVEIHPSLPGPPRPTVGSQCTFGVANGFGLQTGRVSCLATDSPQGPTAGNLNRDIEGDRREDREESDNEYEDEDDNSCSSASESETSSIRSSSETARSRSATPLLSSSLPYDPYSEHPHQAFEQQSLLQSQYRRMSYNTIAEPVQAPIITDSREDEYVAEVEGGVRGHERISSNGAQTKVSPSRPRAYPSYPSYSASYNHSYYSASPATRNRPSTLNLLGSPRSPLSPIHDGYFPRNHRQEEQQPQQPQRPRHSRLPLHQYLQMIYGVDTNSLNIWLPVLWRTSALLRGLGHVLLFTWFPSLVYKGHFQFWTLLMLSFIAIQKGWYTVEWVGGTVARNGVVKVSIFTTLLSLVVYLVGLKLWGILP